MSNEHDNIPEDIQSLLKQVVDHFDKEERYVRERQLRLWKKLKYYWDGFQRLWWSETAHDWRVFDINAENDASQIGDASFYDKPINVFRAYLESLIAAISVSTPAIKCFPDDADNSLDISTAKAGDKISQLVMKHNDATLLWIHSLFVLCTEGMVAAYSYPKEDKRFGMYEKENYKKEEQEVENGYCPNCGKQLSQGDVQLSNRERDEFQPDEDDAEVQDLLKDGNICTNCMMQVDPELKKEKIVVERLTGVTQKAKTRQCLEVYGGLFVKIPNYARTQAEIPYLIYAHEEHYSSLIEKYPDIRDKFTGQAKVGPASGGMYDPYERWARLSTQYFGEYPINTATERIAWLRPSSFNILNSEDDVKKLKKKYPNGAKVTLVNDNFVCAENESLDDCWTITCNPLSDYIHHNPLGLLLTSIQEITNDFVSLILQTAEHGIPQTFVDDGVLNLEQYRQQEVAPGMIIPARAKAGKSLADAFYEVRTASLSPEIMPFLDKVQESGQLVSGAVPSIWGGNQAGSSRTASQYSMSRAQALQRLQTPWKMLSLWWKQIFSKIIPAFIKTMVDDERFVDVDENGNFINVFVRKSETEGKIGSVELDTSDQIPLSWEQKRDAIMNLIKMNNPQLLAAFASSENLELLGEIIGLDDFDIPGADDREKQLEEIKVLLASKPFPDQTGQMAPSVDIEPMVDNHQVEADICRKWLVGDAGRLAKKENPIGYKNVLLHMQRHVNMINAAASSSSPMKPPAITYNFKGDLTDPQVRKEFSKITGTQEPQQSPINPANNGNGTVQ